jgi:hypothetical protein
MALELRARHPGVPLLVFPRGAAYSLVDLQVPRRLWGRQRGRQREQAPQANSTPPLVVGRDTHVPPLEE